jgi:hypothetical protein
MKSEIQVLTKRIHRIESRSRRLKWIGFAIVSLAIAAAAWGQHGKNTVLQAQKIELRDDAGRLRAELATLNGRAALRFFDRDGDVESILVGDDYVIFKKGGDLRASYASNEIRFEDGVGKTFVVLGAREKDQAGQLNIYDYHHNVYATISAEDLAKLHGGQGTP